MNVPFTDPHVTTLYFIVREEEPMIDEAQRHAISLLGELTGRGNRDAEKAMKMLVTAPRLHPLLREQLEELIKGNEPIE